jgi:hypothetical protein
LGIDVVFSYLADFSHVQPHLLRQSWRTRSHDDATNLVPPHTIAVTAAFAGGAAAAAVTGFLNRSKCPQHHEGKDGKGGEDGQGGNRKSVY